MAIVGVGNCANSLLQGVEYYRDAPTTSSSRLMHEPRRLPRARRRVRRRVRRRQGKVGMNLRSDLGASEQHDQVRRREEGGVKVSRGMTHDGPASTSEIVEKAPMRPTTSSDPPRAERRRGRELPPGRLRGGREVVRRAGARRLRHGQLHAGLIARAVAAPSSRRPDHRRRHQVAGRRDDHAPRAHASPGARRPPRPTMQLNVGGNSDFNTLERERLESKKV